VRDKILYNLVFFGGGLIAFSLLLGEWSVFAREKIIKDFTLAVMSLFGLLMAIFVGVSLIQKEIQRKTVLTLLARPFPRWQFLVGKYLGLLGVLFLNLAGMTAFFYLLLWFTDSHPTASLLKAVYLVYFEMAVIVAVALFFSSFSTPVLSALFTLGAYIAGHLSGDIIGHLEFLNRYSARLPEGSAVPLWIEDAVRIAYYFVPNLENFNIRGRIVYELPLGSNYLLYTSLYGCFLVALYLGGACLIFRKRDFI
jgi:ABC-type transport system involved in multi-copper enzyme maturation permease subunit